MKVFITGGSGFIGSNLADSLLANGDEVTVFDNFTTGHKGFLSPVEGNARLKILEGDLLDESALKASIDRHDAVVHLAANADVRFG